MWTWGGRWWSYFVRIHVEPELIAIGAGYNLEYYHLCLLHPTRNTQHDNVILQGLIPNMIDEFKFVSEGGLEGNFKL